MGWSTSPSCPPCPPCLRPQPFSGCFHPGKSLDLMWHGKNICPSRRVFELISVLFKFFMISFKCLEHPIWNGHSAIFCPLPISALSKHIQAYPSSLLEFFILKLFHLLATSLQRSVKHLGTVLWRLSGPDIAMNQNPGTLMGILDATIPKDAYPQHMENHTLLTRSIHFQVLPLFRQKITRVFLFTLQQVYVIWKTYPFVHRCGIPIDFHISPCFVDFLEIRQKLSSDFARPHAQ